jgi:hypothetical protein
VQEGSTPGRGMVWKVVRFEILEWEVDVMVDKIKLFSKINK